MKKRMLATCAAAMLLTGTLLTGCMAPSRASSASSNDPAVVNRAYMSEVRSVFSKVEVEMDSFVVAVQNDNNGVMNDSLQKVDALVDSMSKITVPEGLEKVQEGYVEGSKQLASALHDYVSYRQGGKVQSLTAIQMTYDKGLSTLKETDKLAATL